MEIQKTTKELASKVSHIYAYSWKAAYRGIVPQPYLDALSPEYWTSFLQGTPPYKGFVLVDEGEPVATSLIAPARDEAMRGWGELVSIYVLPQYFGKGYGKKLFSYSVEQLCAEGFRNIYLWVFEENTRARVFYERNGFFASEERETINIGGKDLLEMKYVYHTECADSNGAHV